MRALLNTTQFYQHAPNNWRSSTRRTPSARVVFLRFTCNRSSLSWRSASVLRGGCAPTAAMSDVRHTTGRARTISQWGRLAPVRFRRGSLGTTATARMSGTERKGWRRSPDAGQQPAIPALAPRSRALRPYQGAVAPGDMNRTQDAVPSFAGRPASADRRTSARHRARFSGGSAARHTLPDAGDAGIPANPFGRMRAYPLARQTTIFRKGKGRRIHALRGGAEAPQEKIDAV